MLVAFGHSRSYYARHAGGLHRVFEFRAVEKILIVLLAFFVVLIVVGLAGLSL
jgi:hypothetical protein